MVLVDQAEDIMADTFGALLCLALQGMLDMVLGGPPSWTFSALRMLAELDGGPRPLRGRQSSMVGPGGQEDRTTPSWVRYREKKGFPSLWSFPDILFLQRRVDD